MFLEQKFLMYHSSTFDGDFMALFLCAMLLI